MDLVSQPNATIAASVPSSSLNPKGQPGLQPVALTGDQQIQ
jgi:hypothetical protein